MATPLRHKGPWGTHGLLGGRAGAAAGHTHLFFELLQSASLPPLLSDPWTPAEQAALWRMPLALALACPSDARLGLSLLNTPVREQMRTACGSEGLVANFTAELQSKIFVSSYFGY